MGTAASVFILNAAASLELSDAKRNDLGRFYGSVAQSKELEPVAAMLHAHTMRISVLPAMYAAKSKVGRNLDLICLVECGIRGAAARLSRSVSVGSPWQTWGEGWGLDDPFRPTDLPEQPDSARLCPLAFGPAE